jgi:hypothetical protein
MTIWDCLAAMVRRWPFLVVGLLCTAGAVALVHERPIGYEACGSVIVTAPRSPSFPNIYNNAHGSLVISTALITQDLMSSNMRGQLERAGSTADYQAQVHNTGTTETPAYGEPEMDVCSSSYDPVMSLHTTNAVITKFGQILMARQEQAHVASRFLLHDSVLVAPSETAILGRPSLAYLGTALIGVICTAAGTLWIDEILRGRARRRRLRNRAGLMPARPAG